MTHPTPQQQAEALVEQFDASNKRILDYRQIIELQAVFAQALTATAQATRERDIQVVTAYMQRIKGDSSLRTLLRKMGQDIIDAIRHEAGKPTAGG